MSKLDEILQTYFQTVVKEAVEANGESIVVFAERSKKARAQAAAAVIEAVEGLIGQDLPLYMRGKLLEEDELVDFDLDKDDPKEVLVFVQDNGKNIEKERMRKAIKEWQ